MAIDEYFIKELLKVENQFLYHREGQELEFKEQYNFAGLADYFRDFAAFANNRGGHIIFGVKDSPRIPIGLSSSSLTQFNRIDPEKITGYLLEMFSIELRWEQASIEHDEKTFGVFRIYEGISKPVIAKKDEGRDQQIKKGEIYYRYGGRTQKILYAELENIINKRIEQVNNQWLDLMSKIGKAGPQNAAILDTEKASIEKNEEKILVLDEKLAKKLKFIKEGEFNQKKGSKTLKLIGDIVPIEEIEVIKKVKENLLREYPLSALELAKLIEDKIPSAKRNYIWRIIKDNDLKNNPVYSAYNFRNKRQQDLYEKNGVILTSVPSLYKSNAVDLIISIIESS